jgi:DNA modification methylase
MLNRETGVRAAPYLLLRGSGEQIPLLEESVGLVIATPPYLGASRVSQKECCTRNAEQYDAFLFRILEEAARIIKPEGHILLHTNLPPVKRVKGVPHIEFKVFRRQVRGGNHGLKWVRSEGFATQYVRVTGINWTALPIWLYRSLIRRYSKPGEIIAHIFSGSGNSAIAAMELLRVPILLDLHYHRQVQRRLNKRLRRRRPKQAQPSGHES